MEAFDQLQDRYEEAIDHLVELTNQPSLFDPERTILQQNLFGVDLNEEAVEICRLSIWIKTAKRGKVLADLNENIRIGNSIVSDPAVDPPRARLAGGLPPGAGPGRVRCGHVRTCRQRTKQASPEPGKAGRGP